MEKTIIGWKNIPYSDAAQKALADLPKGKVLAVRMKHVNGGKIQIEFAQRIDSPSGGAVNLLGAFNASDDRFSNRGPRRVWLSVQPTELESLLGLTLADDTPHADIIKEFNSIVVGGQTLTPAIQITEIKEGDLNERMSAAKENYLKRAGKDGNYFYASDDNQRVAQVLSLVGLTEGQTPNHTYIEGSFKSAPTLSNVAAGTFSQVTSDVPM